MFLFLKAYQQFIQEVDKYYIVHVHISRRASFYRKSVFISQAYKRGKKIIIHVHNGAIEQFYRDECNDRQKSYFKKIFLMADTVILLSNDLMPFFSEFIDQNKITILPNSIIIPDYLRNNYSDMNILFLGRLNREKGIFDFLESIYYISGKYPDIHAYVAGDGDLSECKLYCQKKEIENRVTFTGWISGRQKEELLEKCGIFVLPSYSEGMPIALLEAMSYRCIIIATNVGGIPEIINNGRNGFLVEPGNISQLCSCLENVLNSVNRKEIAECAYTIVNHKYNISNNLQSLLNIYNQLNSTNK